MIMLVAIIFAIRTLTVLLHELGHAIPAIIFTGKKVFVYIGSYGRIDKSFKVQIGLLELWIRPMYCWTKGLCKPSSKAMSPNKAIIFVIGGPITSLVIAGFSIYYAFYFDMHGALKLVAIIFLISSIFDFIINITPDKTAFKLDNGNWGCNDGNSLLKLINIKNFSRQYVKAVAKFNNKEYKIAADIFNDFLKKGLEIEEVYRLAISSFIMLEDYQRALEINNQFKTKYTFLADDYYHSGLLKQHLHLFEESIKDFELSLDLNPKHTFSLNGIGYMMTLQEKYVEAIPYLDKAIDIDNSFAYAYNNRGLSKFKIGEVEQGLNDIEQSLKMDTNNSYAYKNLGIYHLDTGNKIEALRLFQKAKEINMNTYGIDDFIAKTSS